VWATHLLVEKEKRRSNPQPHRDAARRNYARHPALHKKRSAESGFKKRYGITLADKKQLFEEQGRACACCGSTDPLDSRNGWHYDHNHQTNKGRGVVCGPCNMTLGFAKESIHRLESCADYLRKHNEVTQPKNVAPALVHFKVSAELLNDAAFDDAQHGKDQD
jgi:hypothetical protein